MKTIEVPTGHIIIKDGERGLPLEFLSLADYGKAKNIKADFLGFHEEINGVPHGELQPLSEKWVITISTQYGCSMNCKFCDVPAVGRGLNASAKDLVMQVETARLLHPEITSGRINLHYARMGEPTFNPYVFPATYIIGSLLSTFKFHPVISTMLPWENKRLPDYLYKWMLFKNKHGAGLQLSINSTNSQARHRMFGGNALPLKDVSTMMKDILRRTELKGRKIALNFALTGDEIDGSLLASYFDPKYFMCKITPMHTTKAVKENKIGNDDGYYSYVPYRGYEKSLKAAGFDVLVFIPSIEEDESRITCGNAVLANDKESTQ